jgi:hypothetical protein
MNSKLKFILALCVMVISGCSCSAPKPVPDPLAGWHFYRDDRLDKTIIDDYKDYIEKLPPEERKFAYYAHCFEDGGQQHAVQIEIPLNGVWWEHVLIYDKNDKRIKTIKYTSGAYRS